MNDLEQSKSLTRFTWLAKFVIVEADAADITLPFRGSLVPPTTHPDLEPVAPQNGSGWFDTDHQWKHLDESLLLVSSPTSSAFLFGQSSLGSLHVVTLPLACSCCGCQLISISMNGVVVRLTHEHSSFTAIDSVLSKLIMECSSWYVMSQPLLHYRSLLRFGKAVH
ncbi:hypothetical protein K435DRAFT_200161 [Dendrothele bispora CBS 962.96]|uniref:Uncharacterized protein n=1 Tax=Dendrothele bispora (strain CBS 962.96) TaxID=1314807 RepID=A0A4S8LTT5_DENBC|nr:hypothetical protein K435DRAFT_200161 [Dendrothele bispora CBS 962.96]